MSPFGGTVYGSSCNTNFKNPYKYLILVYSCTGSTARACRNSGTPSVHHGEQPLSIPLPPTPLTAASPYINHTNKVSTPEEEAKKGREIINFIHDEEYTNVDDNSEPSNCFVWFVVSEKRGK